MDKDFFIHAVNLAICFIAGIAVAVRLFQLDAAYAYNRVLSAALVALYDNGRKDGKEKSPASH